MGDNLSWLDRVKRVFSANRHHDDDTKEKNQPHVDHEEGSHSNQPEQKREGMLKKIVLQLLYNKVKKGEPSEPPATKGIPLKYVIAIATLGALLMLLGNFFSDPDHQADGLALPVIGSSSNEEAAVFKNKSSAAPKTIEDYENRYENQLKETLETISGVRNVSVMVNLDATEEKVIDKNKIVQGQQTEENDREGGKRQVKDSSQEEQTVIIRQGDQETPIIIKTAKPKVRGVLVVAEGTDNIKVKKMVIEAVTRVLDVPIHRISVQPKPKGGE